MVWRRRDLVVALAARDRSSPKRQAKIAWAVYDSRNYTVQQIADEFGVSRPTIYRHLGA